MPHFPTYIMEEKVIFNFCFLSIGDYINPIYFILFLLKLLCLQPLVHEILFFFIFKF